MSRPAPGAGDGETELSIPVVPRWRESARPSI